MDVRTSIGTEGAIVCFRLPRAQSTESEVILIALSEHLLPESSVRLPIGSLMCAERAGRCTLKQKGERGSDGSECERFGTSGVKEKLLFRYSSPPEAQGEYVIYSPEIYRATAKCVLKGPSMSTLCYRLNLGRFAG